MTEATTNGGPAGRAAVPAILAVLGAGAFALCLGSDPDRAWRNLLASNFYFLSISASALFFLSIQHVAGAGWPAVFRRVPESMRGYLPAGSALMLALWFGAHSLYHWADPSAAADPVLVRKAAWLDLHPFFVRMAIILLLWAGAARLMLRASGRQESEGTAAGVGAAVRASVLFAAVFVLTFTVASIDWIMSLEPHWFSTLFPWYVLSSVFVAGLAMMTILVIRLRRAGLLPGLNPHHYHDLGKYVFAFSFFWGYLWFSQYMLIWYGNIPEETAYYLRREGPWFWIMMGNFAVNLGVPFLLLLPADWKKREGRLLAACTVVVAGHWLDVFLLVMPSGHHGAPHFGFTEVAVGAGALGLFLLLFRRTLRAAPPVPDSDPFLAESLHHHG